MPYKYLSVFSTEYEGETLFKVLLGKDTSEPITIRVPKDGRVVKAMPDGFECVGTIELPERMGMKKSCAWLKSRPATAREVFDVDQYADRMDAVDELTDGGIEWGNHDPLEEVPA